MLAEPTAQKLVLLSIGTDNITVLSLYHQNGINKFVLSGKNEQCEQVVNIDDNTWVWFSLYYEFRNYGDTIDDFWVHVNAVNVSAPATCTTTARTAIGDTQISGRAVFGGEPVSDSDGPYQNFVSMEVDDIIYRETFDYVDYGHIHNGWSGARRDFNWFYPNYYLEQIQPTDLYRKLMLL